MTSRKRTHFTEEQKKELESAFESGLTSIGVSNSARIEELAKTINCSVQVVKDSLVSIFYLLYSTVATLGARGRLGLAPL